MSRIKQFFIDLTSAWIYELKKIVHDEGILMFLIIVPLGYPLLYSWIYNNERINEVPVVAVDQSHTSLSREFLRKCDASPEVKVIAYASSLEDAQEAIREKKSEGVIVVPSDFSSSLNTLKQTRINVYCDMNGMFYYKAIIGAVNDVALAMGKEHQIKILGNSTNRQDEISTQPIEYEYVPMFNPTLGYATYIIPAVLALIIQQTLILGIGLSIGTNIDRRRLMGKNFVSPGYGAMRTLIGKILGYVSIYVFIDLWLFLVVPSLFGFTQISQASTLLAFAVPYTLACILFAMTVSVLSRSREAVMLVFVFTSIPLLFMSGVSWPGSNIPGAWKAISYIFPSTFGINAFERINTMGAMLDDVMFEYKMLWAQVVVYLATTILVYRKSKTL